MCNFSNTNLRFITERHILLNVDSVITVNDYLISYFIRLWIMFLCLHFSILFCFMKAYFSQYGAHFVAVHISFIFPCIFLFILVQSDPKAPVTYKPGFIVLNQCLYVIGASPFFVDSVLSCVLPSFPLFSRLL